MADSNLKGIEMIRRYTQSIRKASLTAIAASTVLLIAPAAAAAGTLTPSDPVLTTTRCDVTVNTTNPSGSGWRIIARIDNVIIKTPNSFVVKAGSTWSVAERAIDSTQTFPNGKNSMIYKGAAPDEPYCHDTAPVARDFSFTSSWNVPSSTNLISHVSDPDSGDTYTVTSVSNPSHLTVQLAKNGRTASFVPEQNYVGVGGFDYTATDSLGKTATAHVTINFVQPT